MMQSLVGISSRVRLLLAAVVAVFIGTVAPDTALAERAITLAWNPSPGTGVAGYYVYAWEENAATPERIDAGANAYAIVSGLKEGLRYSFSVTAYNVYQAESPPSPEVSFKVPVPMSLLPGSSPSSPRRIRFPAAPGKWYELQASTDLINWTTIWQTGVANNYSWIEYQDPRARYYTSRFYRLEVH